MNATIHFDKYGRAIFATWLTETQNVRVKFFAMKESEFFPPGSEQDAISWAWDSAKEQGIVH